jgi:hypothetical protein
MNGNEWKSISNYCNLKYEKKSDCTGKNRLKLSATGQKGSRFIITLQDFASNECNECFPEIVYYFDDSKNTCGNDSTICWELFVIYETASGKEYTTRSDPDDYFEITNCDPNSGYISGEFRFSLYHDGELQYTVTNGSFTDVEVNLQLVFGQ